MGVAIAGGLLLLTTDQQTYPSNSGASFVEPFADSYVNFLAVGLALGGALLLLTQVRSEPESETRPAGSAADTTPVELRPAIDETATSAMARQLAIQASIASHRGACAAARATGKRLAEIDAKLHQRMLALDGTYAKCFAAAPTPNA
jgi:hypothetical protein